jgi:hypothetical protein
MLNERGLGERLRSALGDFATNPRRTKERLAGATSSANNQRAAKLAVQALTDHARSSFEAKLAENNLTPDQIVKNLQTWQQLKAQYEKNPTPEVVDAYMQSSQQLKKVGELFGAASQFDVEEPVEAEVVDQDQPKTWDDVDPRSPFKPQAETDTVAGDEGITWADVDERSPFKPQEEEPAPTWDDVDDASPFKPQAEEPAPAVDPRSPFAAGADTGRNEEEAADFRQAVADFEAGRAGEEPQPSKKQTAMAKAVKLATGQEFPADATEDQTLAHLAGDQVWPKLMANSKVMRGATEKLIAPYAAKGINTENLPMNARKAVLKKIFGSIKG